MSGDKDYLKHRSDTQHDLKVLLLPVCKDGSGEKCYRTSNDDCLICIHDEDATLDFKDSVNLEVDEPEIQLNCTDCDSHITCKECDRTH